MMPAGLLKNTATGRYHIIVFREAPPPGGDLPYARRYRSRGHSNDSYETEEIARAEMKTHGWIDCGTTWEWSGTGVPAMTEWFTLPASRTIM